MRRWKDIASLSHGNQRSRGNGALTDDATFRLNLSAIAIVCSLLAPLCFGQPLSWQALGIPLLSPCRSGPTLGDKPGLIIGSALKAASEAPRSRFAAPHLVAE